MHLFELPPELLHLIFEHIVKSRQLDRVMRIRIVSRQFKTYIDRLIFHLRLLSQISGSFELVGFRFRLKPAFPSYVCSYLSYQVLRERSTTSLLGRIRRAATAICEMEGNTGDEAVMMCINSLVRLAMLNYVDSLLREPTVEEQEECSNKDLQEDLYVAAIYLNKQSYVKRLIADGIKLCDTASGYGVHSGVFGKAFPAAAKQGNLSMIKLLLPYYADLLAFAQREILRYASVYGYQEAFDFALDMRQISLPQEYERVAAMLGPDSRVFGPYSAGSPTGWLERWAYLGEVEMVSPLQSFVLCSRNASSVRYTLDKGANPNWANRTHPRAPLLSAIRADNEAIIRILLEAGADPNMPHSPSSPLMEATSKGNISAVKLLLSHGADIRQGCPPPIVIATFKENMDLFRLFREHGARLDTPETGGLAMRVAKSHGLSSMVDALVREGASQDVVRYWGPDTCSQTWWRRLLSPQQ
ncbi:hypothetical protein GQX73_g5986 [Xylaria multiplex]|uniref:F-box domain-containing protein n=1 Tax=Xylaria multiplex TaxID=323545 RepID=A0A7C8N3N3_9PEZI|nr:hypothetical protein GQX73_g5986 [Xylaria multiplex]